MSWFKYNCEDIARMKMNLAMLKNGGPKLFFFFLFALSKSGSEKLARYDMYRLIGLTIRMPKDLLLRKA